LRAPARRLRRRRAASDVCIALVVSLCLAELGFGVTGGGYPEIDDAVFSSYGEDGEPSKNMFDS
jgi:hypothetical protein